MAGAKAGRVVLNGRFSPGERVRLIKVDGPGVLRPPDGAEAVASGRVDENGQVVFDKGVEVGGRYFVSGYHHGQPLDVRITGRAADDPNVILADAPVQAERVRLTDGSFVDEPPEQHQALEVPEGAVVRGQHQVPKGVVQRSDTPRGEAVPIPPEEFATLKASGAPAKKTEPAKPAAKKTTQHAKEAK